MDVYDNIVRMALPRLAYFSASETAWFGVEHLNFGYRDFTRLPGKDDGVFFTKPFVEGKPGIQPEPAALCRRAESRLGPVAAALQTAGDVRRAEGRVGQRWPAAVAVEPADTNAAASRCAAPTIEKVGFIGDRNGPLARRLVALGVPLAEGAQAFNIADGVAPAEDTPGTTLVMLSGAKPSTLQPFNCSLTDRSATALVPDAAHPWTAPFTLPDLYFAEDGPDRFIMRHGIAGPAVERGRVLLRQRHGLVVVQRSAGTRQVRRRRAARTSRQTFRRGAGRDRPRQRQAAALLARLARWPPAPRTRSGGGCSPTPASSSANPPMRTSPRSTSMARCSTRSPSAGFPPRASRPR